MPLMQRRDWCDLPISGADADAVAGYDAYVGEYLGYGANLRALFAVADAAPDCPFLNAHAAAVHLAFEGVEGWAKAGPYLAAMTAHAGRLAHGRERLFCDAVKAWAERRYARTLSLLDEIVLRWPADLCAAKWAHYHAFNLGDVDAMLRLSARTELVHPGTPYARGLRAFALEQAGEPAQALAEGMRAVEIALDDAWAHHAVAHAFESRGQPKEGARWLDRCAHAWETKGLFIREHNWWHAALFRLSLRRYDEALDIFDKRLWGSWPEFPQEQLGAISLLWRLDIRGVDVGERWAPIVKKVRERAQDRFMPFHDLHYLYALARAGEPGEAEAMLGAMTRHADTLAGAEGEAWRRAALPAAHGIKAFAQGNRKEAERWLEHAQPQLVMIGGSNAQRALFLETGAAASNALRRRAH